MIQLQHNYTTVEQSKRLLAVGVPADSADCSIDNFCKEIIRVTIKHERESEAYWSIRTPCWSGLRLMEIFDLCYAGTHNDAEWPKTDAMSYMCGTIMEYIVKTFELVNKNEKFDFTKLD